MNETENFCGELNEYYYYYDKRWHDSSYFFFDCRSDITLPNILIVAYPECIQLNFPILKDITELVNKKDPSRVRLIRFFRIIFTYD